jgi:putative tryptophan/tyrosine transport system substrate-binding protein
MKRRTVMLGAASLPIADSVCAQNAPAKTRVVGLISPAAWQRPWLEPFFAGMRDLGWTQGKDFILEERASGPEISRAAGVAIELRDRGAEVLLTSTTNVAIEVSRATPSLPIVMIASGYPVEVGLAASLARPGGNVTGLSLYAGKEVFSKQVQLLTEARPGLRRIGVLWDYPPPDGPLGIRAMQAAARALGVELELFTLQHAEDLQAALTTLGKGGIDTLFVTLGFVNLQPATWAAIKAHVERHRAFVSLDNGRISEDSFATMIYSTRPGDHVRRAAWYVDRILKGARPGDLPIELPSQFELQLNLRIARQLGIEIPASLMSRADRLFD